MSNPISWGGEEGLGLVAALEFHLIRTVRDGLKVLAWIFVDIVVLDRVAEEAGQDRDVVAACLRGVCAGDHTCGRGAGASSASRG
jgi:hypothetical protein